MIRKHLQGYMRAHSMKHEALWLSQWGNAASQAEREGCELVVFKIPANKAGTMAEPEAVEEIEALLQKRYPIPAPVAAVIEEDSNEHGSRGYDKDYDGAYADDDL